MSRVHTFAACDECVAAGAGGDGNGDHVHFIDPFIHLSLSLNAVPFQCLTMLLLGGRLCRRCIVFEKGFWLQSNVLSSYFLMMEVCLCALVLGDTTQQWAL